MKFGMIESISDPKHYVPMVKRLEERGWDFFYVPDSICYPKEALPEPYPYHGGREFLDGARRLRDLGATHVILSPRNPYEEPDCLLERKLDFIDAMTAQVVEKL